jgi:hypothetical protein
MAYAHEEDGAGRVPQHGVRYAAEDQAAKAAAPVRRQRDQVRPDFLRVLDDLLGNWAFRDNPIYVEAASPQIGSEPIEVFDSLLMLRVNDRCGVHERAGDWRRTHDYIAGSDVTRGYGRPEERDGRAESLG